MDSMFFAIAVFFLLLFIGCIPLLFSFLSHDLFSFICLYYVYISVQRETGQDGRDCPARSNSTRSLSHLYNTAGRTYRYIKICSFQTFKGGEFRLQRGAIDLHLKQSHSKHTGPLYQRERKKLRPLENFLTSKKKLDY